MVGQAMARGKRMPSSQSGMVQTEDCKARLSIIVAWPIIYGHFNMWSLVVQGGSFLCASVKSSNYFFQERYFTWGLLSFWSSTMMVPYKSHLISTVWTNFVKGPDISQPWVYVSVWQLMENNGHHGWSSLAWEGLSLVQLHREYGSVIKKEHAQVSELKYV